MQSLLKKTGTKEVNNLPFIIAAGILSVILWQFPALAMLLFPFSMFVTYIHEACHGLAAILTGGSLVRFTMELDTSGLAFTAGGMRSVILAAGYVGSSLVGALLLIAAFRKGMEKPVLGFLGVFFLVFTLLFARNLVAFISGIFFAVSMFSIIKIRHTPSLTIFLAFLAVQTCFNSVQNIFELVILSGRQVITDAHLMSAEFTGNIIPPIVFALIWGLISLFIFIGALKFSLKK